MKRRCVLGLVMGIFFSLTACEESKIEEAKEAIAAPKDLSAKPTYQQNDSTFLLAVGDSVVNAAESALLQLAEIPSEAQELFVEHPEKFPMVQSVLERYGARLERQAFDSPAALKKFITEYPSLDQRHQLHVQAQLSFSKKKGVLYQRPILIRRRNCASCEEPSLVDYTATHVSDLRVFSALGKPEGYEVGDLKGVWRIYFPENMGKK